MVALLWTATESTASDGTPAGPTDDRDVPPSMDEPSSDENQLSKE